MSDNYLCGSRIKSLNLLAIDNPASSVLEACWCCLWPRCVCEGIWGPGIGGSLCFPGATCGGLCFPDATSQATSMCVFLWCLLYSSSKFSWLFVSQRGDNFFGRIC